MIDNPHVGRAELLPHWDPSERKTIIIHIKFTIIIFVFVFADLLSCVSEAIQIDLPFYEELVLFLLSSPDPHHEARH